MDSYNKTVWVNGSNPPINAENLNHIESGIEAVNQAVTAAEERITTSESKADNAMAGLGKKADVNHTHPADSAFSQTSTNPVQNKVVTAKFNEIVSGKADKATTLSGYGITDGQTKIDSSHKLSSDLVDDTDQTNKFVTDADKTNWNNKLSSANGAVKSSNIDNGAVTLQKLESGVIDSTLSTQGAAAEAKATGNKIKEVENNFIELTNHILDTVDYTRLNISFIYPKRIRNDGVIVDYPNGGTTWAVSNEIDISQYDYLKINARAGWGDAYFAVYDENHSPIYFEVSPSSEIGVFNDYVILPENAHYLAIAKLGVSFDAYVSYPVFEAPTKTGNKVNIINPASPSNTDYPTTAAVIEYVKSVLRGLTNNGN